MKKIIYILFFLSYILSFAQEKTVYGVVRDYYGELILGANVKIEGTTRGTSTDFDGSYKIKAKKNEYLVFSSIGTKSQRIIADKTEINVELKDDGKISEIEIPRIYKYRQKIYESITIDDIKYGGTPKYDFKKSAKKNEFIIYVIELTNYDFKKEDLEFQNKYNVKYSLIGNHEIDYLIKFNKLTFKHLKKKYKKNWLTEIRKDAVGIEKFVK